MKELYLDDFLREKLPGVSVLIQEQYGPLHDHMTLGTDVPEDKLRGAFQSYLKELGCERITDMPEQQNEFSVFGMGKGGCWNILFYRGLKKIHVSHIAGAA